MLHGNKQCIERSQPKTTPHRGKVKLPNELIVLFCTDHLCRATAA